MKRILVISNSAFSLTSSNGRTLAKLFEGYNPKDLAQFYLHGNPDFSVCKNYYRVTNGDAFKSAVTFKPRGGRVTKEIASEAAPRPAEEKKVTKTPFSMLLREAVWGLGRWKSKEFYDWLHEFSPEGILIFVGDNPFLLKLARRIAKKYKIPVTIYTTEDYYFKKFNYINYKKSLCYCFFRFLMKRSYRWLEPLVDCGFFNTPLLTEMYKKEFSFKCETMFARSDMEFIPKSETGKRVSYLGNLGLNRHLALMEIADALGEISPEIKINVYGNASEEVKNALKANPNIGYLGFVSYEEVVKVIHNSDLLVHAEYNSPRNNADLKVAFSTKVPDSICSGTPLLMYGDKSLAEVDFMLKNKCAFVVHSKENLKEVLSDALFDSEKRKKVINKAKEVRDKFFLSDKPMVNYYSQ